ncbi:MAG: hypothetical protein QF769_04780, partial [Candidatus Marinimicrobia bacterium]|nr:hypothetical protein [Candidatus Neomarinimicrobiota bacterium]
MKKLNGFSLVLLLISIGFAVPPDWSVNPSAFEFNASMTGILVFNDGESSDSQDIIAAFSGDECRGVKTDGTVFPPTGQMVFGITLYGNSSGEILTFKAYDSSNDQINENIGFSYSFIPNDIIGSAEDPVEWNFTSSLPSDPNFDVTITANADDVNYELTFGFSPEATDGYDSDYDQYAPPAPPPPAFDAALAWGGERYYTQIVNGSEDDLVEHVWDIQLAFPPSNMVTLNWDSDSLTELGSFVIQDAFGGLMINVDMTLQNSVDVTNPALNTLKILVTPSGESPPPPPEETVVVMFQVDMNEEEVSTEGVHITGTFNNWEPGSNEMDDSDGNGIYSIEIELEAGSYHEYKFLNGDTWGTEEAVPAECTAGNYGNRFVQVLDMDMVLDEVCFGSCTVCEDEPPPGGNPDFQVFLTAVSEGTDYSMSFGFSPDATDGYDSDYDQFAPPAPPPPAFDAALGWNGERYYTQIVHGSADDLIEHEWEVQLQYPANNEIMLAWDNSGWSDLGTFILQDAFGGAMFSVDMTIQDSLFLDNPAFTVLKLLVTPSGESQPPSEMTEVTFTVLDEGNYYQDVRIKGDFTNWESLPMQGMFLDSVTIWTYTIELGEGSYEWGAIENDGSELGIWLPELAGFETNPIVTIDEDGNVSGDIGFTVPYQDGPGETVVVIFQVDMNEEEVSPDGVHIAGSFNNWDPTLDEMVDSLGNGIYA